jgi:RNA polymerase sigma-70 factor, ECF subfamily
MRNPTEQIADALLVMDAQSGHCDALEMLVSRWQKRFWGHAYSLTGRPDAAWDITQESWLDIVRGLARLKDADKFGAWAYRIVSNKASDWIRRNGGISLEDHSESDPRESAIEPEQREIAGDVHSILRRLPGHSQAVLKLYYLEGFGVAEIAHILGTPEGTVKSRLHTARAEFRKFWESPGEISPVLIPASGKEKQNERRNDQKDY